ncbi:hypothetical protein [Acidocella sp.]|uniref:hypothetical protein n=1 Tax=Acidocella sp. TaxID=50710 RepID=UPI00261294AF|nr:hypothetical protein [Acidocella sp.]
MNFAGRFRHDDLGHGLAPDGEAQGPAVMEVLRQGVELIDGISAQLQQLDCLMLAGKPIEISAAAADIELALKNAAPAISRITEVMRDLGADNLFAAAAQLRRIEQQDAASLAEALRFSLARVATRTACASRRAQQMNRGLNTALKALTSFGLNEGGRLIAEA